ncbi:hypothetical protein [Caldinitratiruptor microaerophilus]|uniref:Uncharacterized protein n=1 Tax=Caldinitratiruptor microaerophilus TaxID=671077 RepID=A0AA35G987_9FIRM|nr:hypothetical protein [Caldinitratiruptor microaerophilus]BDG61895.1 hypothetical protein caldi_29850 [Caldinitratiruptor microaerophilus]
MDRVELIPIEVGNVCSCGEEQALYALAGIRVGRRCLADLVERAIQDPDVWRDLELRGISLGGGGHAGTR